MVNFQSDGAAFLNAMHSGQTFETDEESWYYWLEVLPPVYMGRDIVLPRGEKIRASFGFVEGADYITAFWKKGGRYYGCRTGEVNRG